MHRVQTHERHYPCPGSQRNTAIDPEDDVAALKRLGRIASYMLKELLDPAEPGMTTLELEKSTTLTGTRGA